MPEGRRGQKEEGGQTERGAKTANQKAERPGREHRPDGGSW
jgi:hypothetical protein